MRGMLQYFFVWEREMSKEALDSVLGLEESFFEEESKPGPCRQITIDKEQELIVLKLDNVELFKQSISKLDKEVSLEFIESLMDAWRNEETNKLATELKIGEV